MKGAKLLLNNVAVDSSAIHDVTNNWFRVSKVLQLNKLTKIPLDISDLILRYLPHGYVLGWRQDTPTKFEISEDGLYCKQPKDVKEALKQTISFTDVFKVLPPSNCQFRVKVNTIQGNIGIGLVPSDWNYWHEEVHTIVNYSLSLFPQKRQ